MASFQLANGNITRSAGRTTARLQFVNDDSGDTDGILCYFNVFRTLALPVLMGMSFLSVTETLSKYTHRLVDLPCNFARALRICAIGDAATQVSCRVNHRYVLACADTGSEIALISKEYAQRRGFYYAQSSEKLMFADGSIGYTCGSTVVDLKLQSVSGREIQSSLVTLHVFQGLSYDVLLDEDLLYQLNIHIFQDAASAIIAGVVEPMANIAAIIRLGAVERAISNAKDKMFGLGDGQSSRPSTQTSRTGSCLEIFDRSKLIVLDFTRNDDEALRSLNDRFQQELRHRAWVEKQGYAKDSPEQQAAERRWREFEGRIERELMKARR